MLIVRITLSSRTIENVKSRLDKYYVPQKVNKKLKSDNKFFFSYLTSLINETKIDKIALHLNVYSFLIILLKLNY